MNNSDIKKLRNKLYYSQQELADILGVDVLTVSRWERNKQRPRPVHLRKIERLKKKVGK